MPRPSTPLISRRGAAEAALAVIDEVGLDNMSLALVAKRLGVKSPSLYHHFRDKSELLEEVARLLLIRIPPIRRAPGEMYEERIVALCVSLRRSLLRHPNAAPLMLQFFPRHVLLAGYNEAAGAYPFPPEVHVLLMEGTEKLAFGSALFAAMARAHGVEPAPPVDAAEFPQLARALSANPLDEEETFAETVRSFFAGVTARLRNDTIGERLRPEESGTMTVDPADIPYR